ncbi:MAG: hypothetical protein HRT51_05475 [Colwellia sp.]|nr:hypothetical protein [Colwellia sp.]
MIPTNNKLEMIDLRTGIVKEVPISEFIMNSYKEAIIHGREKEIDVTSIIRAIHQKRRLTKKSYIKLRVDDSEADIEISALALETLHMYSQDEINNLVKDPLLSNEFEKIHIAAVPVDIQPSTDKQRGFALGIAELLDINLSYEILASKIKIGIFINEYQNKYDRYASDAEGVEFISVRLEGAIIKYFSKEESWVTLFNIALDLYLQISQRGRNVILKTLSKEISDNYWNEARNLPEGDVICEIISEISFSLEAAGTHAEKFKRIHEE